MSTAAELVAEVTKAGLRLDLRADGTVYVCPKSRVTPEIIERLRAVKAELIEYLRRERLADSAADELRRDPTLQRAVKAERDGQGYVVAVAVRVPDAIATAILTVPHYDGLELLTAFEASTSVH